MGTGFEVNRAAFCHDKILWFYLASPGKARSNVAL
jgi:hypothetical protein